MNKAELIKSMAEKSGLTQKQADAALDGFIETIKETLAKGEDISLVGFGSFDVQERAARTGRNPATGEEIQIAASKAPRFKAGKALKDAIPQPEAPKPLKAEEPKKAAKKITKK